MVKNFNKRGVGECSNRKKKQFHTFFTAGGGATTNITTNLSPFSSLPSHNSSDLHKTFHSALDENSRQRRKKKVETSVEIKKLFHGQSLFPPASFFLRRCGFFGRRRGQLLWAFSMLIMGERREKLEFEEEIKGNSDTLRTVVCGARAMDVKCFRYEANNHFSTLAGTYNSRGQTSASWSERTYNVYTQSEHQILTAASKSFC